MPTLIRLLGNSAVNTQEVRNTFKEPVLIPANAKIALTGVNAVLADDLANEKFVISGTTGQFNIGLTGTLANAVLPNGEYTAGSFVDAFETAANYTGTNVNRTALLGVHHEIDLVDGKLSINTYKGELADADLDQDIWFTEGLAPASVSATAFTATATLASATALLNNGSRVPLVSSKITATFVNADTVDMGIGACSYEDVTKVYWGLRVVQDGTNRQYQYGVLNSSGTTVWTDIGTVYAQANDVVTLQRFGEYVRIDIIRAGGAGALVNNIQNGITREQADTSKDLIVWFVGAATGGSMATVQCTQIEGTNPPQMNGLNTSINAGLQFITTAGAFNSILALYCGFVAERNIIAYKGDPAHVASRAPILGLPAYPGILITIDGLGLLKSHDGASTAKSPANIVYSVNELQNLTQYLQLDVPEPLYLDVGNPHPINVNELRVRLYEAGGYNPLTFIGNPSFSFIIDY